MVCAIDFDIPCEVVPKQSCRGGRRGWYQTDKIKINAEVLASFILPHRPAEPLTGALRVWYLVHYAYRAKEPQRNRNRPIPKDTEPDAEQLAKQLGDVLESCRFFANDAQIADLHVVKMWDKETSVRIRIFQMGPNDLVGIED